MHPQTDEPMRVSALAFAAIACTSAIGCIPQQTVMMYDVGLKEVQRPAATQQRYGEQAITQVRDSAGRYRFEDKLIAGTFLATSNKIIFSLENKTEFPIQIAWTEAAFVDPKGESQPVMHSGVKYTDCTSPKAPSVLVAKGHLSDEIVPCNYVHFGYSSWVEGSYLPNPLVMVDSAPKVAAKLTQENRGKRIQLLLPIKTQDVVNDYTFTFEVQGASPFRTATDHLGKP